MVLVPEDAGRSAELTPPQRGTACPLRVLSSLAGLYGVGLGLLVLPTALFVGPHLFFAAVAHLLLGVTLLLAGRSIDRGSRRAEQFARFIAVLVTVFCTAGVVTLSLRRDWGGVAYWGGLGAFFAVMSMIRGPVKAPIAADDVPGR